MKKLIKWGIIGAGNIAAKFAEDMKEVENSEIVAIASTSITRAQNFALKFDASYAYSSYEEIFDAPIDAVYIATPHTAHYYCTLLALKNKIPVLCEKPFAMNEAQVLEMIETAKRNDTFLMEAMWTRFLPFTDKVIEIVKSGAIGKIKTIHADFGFKSTSSPERRALNPALGGGAFLDIGIYPAFLALLLLDYPTRINAISIFGKTGVDVTTSFLYGYDAEATAVLSCSFESKTKTEANIYGSKGSICIGSRFHEAKKITLNVDGEKPETFDFPRKTIGYNFEIEEVNECVRQGLKESSKMPLSLSLKLIHLLDKTREKAGINYLYDEV